MIFENRITKIENSRFLAILKNKINRNDANDLRRANAKPNKREGAISSFLHDISVAVITGS